MIVQNRGMDALAPALNGEAKLRDQAGRDGGAKRPVGARIGGPKRCSTST